MEEPTLTLEYAQVSTRLFADRKVRRLAQLIEQRDVYTAIGVYVEALLESYAAEEPCEAEGPDDIVAVLTTVGLLDEDQRIPHRAFAKRLESVNRKRSQGAERQRRYRERHSGVTHGDASPSSVTLRSLDSVTSGESEGDGPMPAGPSMPVYQWLSANVRYVDPLGGMGPMVEERVKGLGADEVIRRLEVLHHRGKLDPGDAFGYITGITDGFRKRSKPPTDDDEVNDAIARRKAARKAKAPK